MAGPRSVIRRGKRDDGGAASQRNRRLLQAGRHGRIHLWTPRRERRQAREPAPDRRPRDHGNRRAGAYLHDRPRNAGDARAGSSALRGGEPEWEPGSRTGDGRVPPADGRVEERSEEHTSELQSRRDLVCRLLLEKKKKKNSRVIATDNDNIIVDLHLE